LGFEEAIRNISVPSRYSLSFFTLAGKVLAKSLGRLADHRSSCAKADHRSTQLKHQRHFDEGDAASREAVRIGKMINDLDRLVRIIDCDIATEEQRTRVFNRSDAAYPLLARTLAARRDNLMDTIAALELRLAGVVVASVPELA
jgi:hypothetical protein